MKETRSGRPAASFRAHLMSLATAVPSHCVHQSTAAAVANDLFAHRFPGYARVACVFETSGIQTRHMIKPLDWYQTRLGWPERMVAYLEGAGSLFVAAAEKALAAADCKTNDVDIIVTISSTGIATPSLEARVASRMGFRADVERVPVSNLQSSPPSCPASQHPAGSRHTARA